MTSGSMSIGSPRWSVPDPHLIPYGHQAIDQDDIDAVVTSLRADWLTTGPKVAEFESALCKATGARHAVAVSSGTAALHTAYASLGIGPGDEVVTSPLTFAATSNAALYVGATPVFADIHPETGTLSSHAVRRALTPRSKAIVAVDYAGHPADYDALRRVAADAGVALVADAAHSLGASLGGDSVGTLADVTTLSFHPVKHITTGEGGALLTDDDAVARRARAFRSHGIIHDRAHLSHDEGPWYTEMQELGFNYRLTDVQSALGLSQVAKLPAFLGRRREIAARYSAAFEPLASVVKPTVRPDVVPAWHLYVLRVATDPALRRAFFEALRGSGLGVQVHYLPVYRHPYYQDHGYAGTSCPAAEDFYARAVSIPIYPAMSDAEVAAVIKAVLDAAVEVLG